MSVYFLIAGIIVGFVIYLSFVYVTISDSDLFSEIWLESEDIK